MADGRLGRPLPTWPLCADAFKRSGRALCESAPLDTHFGGLDANGQQGEAAVGAHDKVAAVSALAQTHLRFVLLRTPVSAPISTRSGSLSRRYGRSCFCVSAARAGRTIAQLRCDFGASLDRPNTE